MYTKLSICIPIYNCAEFVPEALESILPQTGEGIEVIVYDGGSTDNTPELMANYVSRWPNLHYHRGDARGGIDADLQTCVGFARGEYCWLFSGDDVMRPGAIAKLMKWLESGRDIYICKHTICNKKMVVSHEHPVMRADEAFSADLHDATERLAWFRRAATTEAFFSFLSGLIVRRNKWQEGILPEAFAKSCWGHVARFFGLISSGLSVCYVAEVWLDQRGENDSFADKGLVNRFRIGIEGYHRMADTYFGHDSKEAFHVRRVIRNEFNFGSFVSAMLLCRKNPEIEDRKLLDRLARMVYCDATLMGYTVRFAYSLFPYCLYVMVRPIYRMIRPFIR